MLEKFRLSKRDLERRTYSVSSQGYREDEVSQEMRGLSAKKKKSIECKLELRESERLSVMGAKCIKKSGKFFLSIEGVPMI